MANITNLEQFLTDVATAIRTKKETTGQISAENFDSEILSIETGIDTSDATATANDLALNKTAYVNGEKIEGNIYNVTSNSIISGGKFLENSPFLGVCTDRDLLLRAGGAIEITEEQVSTKGNITPEKIVKGNTIFGVEGTAETGAEINNQDKEITVNGTYQADEGYTGLGTVTVNVPQTGDVPVKLFETKEAMQSDPDAKEGDLAVVYRSEIQNATVDSRFQVATFPDTVVLDTAITDYVDIMYRAVDSSKRFDCFGSLDNSRLMMDCYTESGRIRIQYTSSDGITYTRTDSTGNPVDFGTEIYYKRAEYWNDAIGKFIQVDGSTFEGLFVGKSVIKQIQPIKMSTMVIDTETNVPKVSDVITLNYNVDSFAEKIYPMTKYIDTLEGMTSHSRHPYCVYLKDNNTVSIIADGSSSSSVMLACPVFVNSTFKGLVAASSNVTNFYEWQFNLNTGEYIGRNDIVATDYTTFGSSTNKYYYATAFNDYYYIGNMDWTGSSFTYIYSLLYNNTSNSANTSSMTGINGIAYFLAPTQLTLAKANELLPGKIAYGKNGVVEGDGSIYDNLSKEYILSNILGVPKLSNGTYALNNKQYFISSSKELEIPPTKVQFIKQSDFINRDKIYLVSKRNCISTENDDYKFRDKYLSKSGEFYAEYTKSDTTLYDIVRTSDKLIVASIVINKFLDYADGKLIYTKSALSETVSQKIYMYDIDTQTETELGDTPTIPSAYSWNYKYSYYKVYGTTLLYSVNGEYSNSRIAASVRLYDLLTGVVTDLPTINVSTTYSIGYHILPILHEDGKQISIFQRSRKNGTETAIYYMYIYNTVEHTLTTKANGITTNLMWDFSNYLYKEEPIIVGSKAFGRFGNTWYVMDILNPVAVTDIVLDNGKNIFDYHHRNMDYITVSGQTVFVSDKQYDTSTKVLALTYGDSFIFGGNCTISIVANSGISDVDSCDLANIRYDGTHYTVDMVKGMIIGKDIDVYAYNLSDNTDFNHSIVNSNNLTKHTISLLDNTDIYEKSGPITQEEYVTAIDTADEILGSTTE